jgi:hypothetical protein
VNIATYTASSTFYQAIDEMLANASPSDKLSKRLQAIFAQASISRRDMLGAMIGAGMNIAPMSINGTSFSKHSF